MPTASVHDKLDLIINDVAEIKTSVGIMNHEIEGNTQSISRIDKIVCGNGDPGLKGSVQSLKESQERMNKITWTVVGTLVAAILGAILKTIMP